MMVTSARLAAAGKPAYGRGTGAQYEGLVVWFNSMVASARGSVLSAPPAGCSPSCGTARVPGPGALER
ncbi:hypothetical protein ACSNOI_10890 [Actinomadura kijaniata]|uniref:hypothetical protein n=1 Tax=Actinomadura kijaniata TaxID=46161 RepID=UPI003F1B4D11